MISFALADGNISKQEESSILDYINKKITEMIIRKYTQIF